MIDDEEIVGLHLPPKEYERIEETVVELFMGLNISSVPIDPFAIAEQMGYIVKEYSELERPARHYLRTGNADGCSLYNPKLQRSIIFFDDDDPLVRTRFTAMHEIGHIRLEHKEESDLANQMANYFAAYALAPSPLIGRYKCEDYIDVANTFNVSRDCAAICFERYNKWLHFGGQDYKPYEICLLNLFFPEDEGGDRL